MGKLFKIDLNDQYGYKIAKQGKGYKVTVRQTDKASPLILVDKPVKNHGGFLYFKITPFNRIVIDGIANRLGIGEIIDDKTNVVNTDINPELTNTKEEKTMPKQTQTELNSMIDKMVDLFKYLPKDSVDIMMSITYEQVTEVQENAKTIFPTEEGYKAYLGFLHDLSNGNKKAISVSVNRMVKLGVNIDALIKDFNEKYSDEAVKEVKAQAANVAQIKDFKKLLEGDVDVKQYFSKIIDTLKEKGIDMVEILKAVPDTVLNTAKETAKEIFVVEDNPVGVNPTVNDASPRRYEVDALGFEIRNYSANEVSYMLENKTYPYVPHAFTDSDLGWYMDYSQYLPENEKSSYTYKEVLAMCQYDEQERFLRTPVKDGEYGEGPDNAMVGAMCFVAEHWKKIVGGGVVAGLGYGLYRTFFASSDTHEDIVDALGDVASEVSEDVSNS